MMIVFLQNRGISLKQDRTLVRPVKQCEGIDVMARAIFDTPIGPCIVPEWKKKELDEMTDDEMIAAYKKRKAEGFIDPFLYNELQHKNILYKAVK